MQQGINGKVTTWEEEAVYVQRLKSNWVFISNMFIILSLVAALVSVGVLMYTRVEHKIREIGIMKAIGARNSFVLRVILTESLIFGITGVILGSIMGLSITKYWEVHPIMLSTAESNVISASFSFYLVLIPSIVILLATLLAGLYPAWRASRINIIKATWHG
ncbi:MAG: FtsX-like permease family protein [Candidatus Methanoperedens sp.]|nr:FtsX-like permease family protein [Candidatus Methanoperedens sp.]